MEQEARFLTDHFANLGDDEAIEIRCIREDPHDAQTRITPSISSAVAFARFYDGQEYNVYYGVSPRLRGARTGRRESVTSVTHIWADLDGDLYPDGKAEALATIKAFTLPPSVLVDSGGGYHALWELDEPVPPEGFEQVQGIVRRLANFLGADPKVADVARILRLPGTRNHKAKYAGPLPVGVLTTLDRQYALRDFLAILPEPAPVTLPASGSGTSPAYERDVTLAEAADALAWINPDQPHLSYEEWTKVLMAIHAIAPGPDGLDVAEAWAHGKPGEVATKWKSFRSSGVTAGTLFWIARRFGWEPPFQHAEFVWEPEAAYRPKDDAASGAGERGAVFHFIPYHDFIDMDFGTNTWLVENLLAAGSTSLVVAKQKVGKSTLALNLAFAVATGQPFLGRTTTQGKVFYLSLEQSQILLQQQYVKLRDAWGATRATPIAVDPRTMPLYGAFPALLEILQEEQPALLIIDPLFKFVQIKDGNDYSEATRAMAPLLELAQKTGTHICCLHHAHKGVADGADAVLGSIAFAASVEATLMLKKDPVSGQITYEVESRWEAPGEPLILDFDEQRRVHLRGTKTTVNLEDARNIALGALRSADCTRSEIGALAPWIDGFTMTRALEELVAATQITKISGKPEKYHLLTWHKPAAVAAPANLTLVEEE